MEPSFSTIIQSTLRREKFKISRPFIGLYEIILETEGCEDSLIVWISVAPCDNADTKCAVVAEMRLTVGEKVIRLDQDLFSGCGELYSKTFPYTEGSIVVELALLEFLPIVDITQQTPYRQLQLLCASKSYFVDPFRLANLGGSLFTEWRDKYEDEQTRVVVQLATDELECLLDAVMRYETVVVYRRNFRKLSSIAERYKIISVMRSVESYLMSAHLHPIRRLEYAVELRLARLFEFARRELGQPHEIMDKVHEFLIENENTMFDLHPKLLATLNITAEDVCIS